MRHKVAGRKLGRNATHRRALLKNLSRELLKHEKIITTLAKAKELRTVIEPMITRAKEDTLHNRRQLLKVMTDEAIIHKLFTDIGPRYKERPGGYTRIFKLPKLRIGDSAAMAYIELVK